MSNSSLITYTNLSNKHSGQRTQPISKIAIHHMAGKMTAKQCADYLAKTDRKASANYLIGWDGSIAMGVEECNRAWTTSSAWCDQRAVTIEVSNANNNGGDWLITDEAYNSLLDLVTDICKRNNIRDCSYTGTKDGVLQKHEWYAHTNCPGGYLGRKFPEISRIVNDRLKLTGAKWIKNDTGWWYRREDNTYPANKWEKIDGKWYHFNTSGYMQTGWLYLSGKWYYLDSSGAMKTGWVYVKNKWYYLNEDGSMRTGWVKYKDKWYYLEERSGNMISREVRKVGNKWYYFNESGEMLEEALVRVDKNGNLEEYKRV